MIQHYGPFGSAVSGGDRVSGPWTEWQGFRAMGSPSEPRRPFQDLGQSHYLSEGLRFRTRDSAGTIPSQRQLPCCMSNAWQPPPPPTGTIACGLPAASPHKPAVCCPLPVLTQTPWDEDLGDPLCGTTQRLPSPEAGTPKAAASSSRYS